MRGGLVLLTLAIVGCSGLEPKPDYNFRRADGWMDGSTYEQMRQASNECDYQIESSLGSVSSDVASNTKGAGGAFALGMERGSKRRDLYERCMRAKGYERTQ